MCIQASSSFFNSRLPGLKIKPNDANGHRLEPVIRPKDRVALIREQIESTLERQKADHHWEDLVDVSWRSYLPRRHLMLLQNPYQPPLVPYASRLFKYIPPPDAPIWPPSISQKDGGSSPPTTPFRSRAVRMRYGRGGRVFLDRRDNVPLLSRRLPRSSLFALDEVGDPSLTEDVEEREREKRTGERWKFDTDDTPPIGPDGAEEHDRQLVDDYDASYVFFFLLESIYMYLFRFLRHAMTLHTESDHLHLVTDQTLVVFNSEGRPQGIVPYRLGVPPIIMRRDAQGVVRPFPGMLPAQVQHMLALQNGAMPQHLKKMQPSGTAPQMRISSGGMRPPSISATNSQSSPPQPLQSQSSQSQPTQPPSSVGSPITHHQSPPAPSPVQAAQHSVPNGVGRPAISMPHVEVAKADTPNGVNGVAAAQPESHGDASTAGTPRPKSQNVSVPAHVGIPPNGYHLPLANMSAALLNSTYLPQGAAGGLSHQQVQNLKSAFANLSATEMAALNGGRALPASYLMPNMQLPPNANVNLKLQNTRQTQWAMGAQQRPASVVNGMDGHLGGLANGMVAVSPTLSQSVPVRSPSANGQRAGLRNGAHVNGQHSVSPHLQASPTLPNISQSQSPPRVPLGALGLPSPSLQQQPVGSNQNGY